MMTLVQKDFNKISASFQNLFVVVFTWKTMLPVQLLLELEANLLDQNVNELEFELFRM